MLLNHRNKQFVDGKFSFNVLKDPEENGYAYDLSIKSCAAHRFDILLLCQTLCTNYETKALSLYKATQSMHCFRLLNKICTFRHRSIKNIEKYGKLEKSFRKWSLVFYIWFSAKNDTQKCVSYYV